VFKDRSTIGEDALSWRFAMQTFFEEVKIAAVTVAIAFGLFWVFIGLARAGVVETTFFPPHVGYAIFAGVFSLVPFSLAYWFWKYAFRPKNKASK